MTKQLPRSSSHSKLKLATSFPDAPLNHFSTNPPRFDSFFCSLHNNTLSSVITSPEEEPSPPLPGRAREQSKLIWWSWRHCSVALCVHICVFVSLLSPHTVNLLLRVRRLEGSTHRKGSLSAFYCQPFKL